MQDAQVTAVRHFSRYYTRRIGILEDTLLGSGLTLPQGRLLFEIAHGDDGRTTPGAMAARLGLDAGYVSRLLATLEARGLIERRASDSDRRSVVIAPTGEGWRLFREIDGRSQSEVATLLGGLSAGAQQRIVDAMRTIERDLEGIAVPARPAATIRAPQAGEIGWVVHRHGALYHAEYGWDWTFEAAVARIAADYVDRFDPARDCCRIAEADGGIVGSAFVVATDAPDVAKLRLVYVEPGQRGTGLGQRLVEDCMAFARSAGYRRMTLWTNDVLVAARRLYRRLDFQMTAAEPVTAFGHAMVSETWERDL